MVQELQGKTVRVVKGTDAGTLGFQIMEGILEKCDPEKGYIVLRANEPVGGWPEGADLPILFVIPWGEIRFITTDKIEVREPPKSAIALPTAVVPNGVRRG